jgi:DNA-binding NtrC family response regulator
MSEERLLIVDDEPAMRLALREVLRGRWDVKEACDAREALDCIRENKFELVLTDVRMPRMTGLELLTELGELSDAPDVIVMTAYATIEDAVAAMRIGARDYLMKPFSADVVLEAVERALARRSEWTSAMIEENTAQANGKRGRDAKSALIADDPSMRQVVDFVEAIADSEATVLITGESGVGKEVLAQHIHRRSRRVNGPFVAVNCAALPDTLLESELFGFEKGAFTGAVQSRPGKFEIANGGTILLDEISEMPSSLQAKLLRVLQEHTVDPIGARAPVQVDIRVLATSNRDLTRAVAEGEFRQDLYYRLDVIGVEIPPLRERPRDIEPLARHFVQKHAVRNRRPAPVLTDEILDHLLQQTWAGNVRELENFMERAVLLTRGTQMRLGDLHLSRSAPTPFPAESSADGPVTLAQMERRMILSTLQGTGGNRTRAAELLGVSVRTIRNKINEYGLKEAV